MQHYQAFRVFVPKAHAGSDHDGLAGVEQGGGPGGPTARRPASLADAIASKLEDLGGVSTPTDLVQRTGLPFSAVWRALAELVAGGRARRLPRQGHSQPYQWVGDNRSADAGAER